MNYLKAACEHLGVDPERVLSHHVYEDHIALVVDNGIKGCPKHKVPLDGLVITLEAGEYTADEAILPDGVRIEGHREEPVRYHTYGTAADVFPELEGEEEPNATKGARDLAFEHGLNVRLIKGTGSGGRVTKRDVQEVIDAEY